MGIEETGQKDLGLSAELKKKKKENEKSVEVGRSLRESGGVQRGRGLGKAVQLV